MEQHCADYQKKLIPGFKQILEILTVLAKDFFLDKNVDSARLERADLDSKSKFISQKSILMPAGRD